MIRIYIDTNVLPVCKRPHGNLSTPPRTGLYHHGSQAWKSKGSFYFTHKAECPLCPFPRLMRDRIPMRLVGYCCTRSRPEEAGQALFPGFFPS